VSGADRARQALATAVDQNLDGWQAVAAGWERQRGFVWDMTREVSERLVELLDPRPGETILELAAGPGDTGFLAAAQLEPDGRLLSTDIAPDMVEAARRRAAALELSNTEFAVADAQRLDLPDASVDGVLCRWGYMLVPDPGAALAETRRVLRSDGRVAFAVWAEHERNPWGTAAGRALVGLGLMDKPDPSAPGPFALGVEDHLLELVRAAGLSVELSEEIAVSWRTESFDEWWSVQHDLSRLLATALAQLTTDDVARVREATRANLAAYEADDGQMDIPGVSRIVLARRLGSS
jgi:SAM-dependent methyltransferase